MTLSEAWDRMFWSAIITVFIGVVWIRFLESAIGPCDGPGLIVALAAGITFFGVGWRNAARKKSEANADTSETKDAL
ncbi:MAG: hypothetical protein IT323_13310 [Anaerolineae bacterium]|nr:hypothetical protein [Anaerolineae bacterium]